MAIAEHVSSTRDIRPSHPRGASQDHRRYVRPPEPIFFPVSEEMPETNRHLELRTLLYQLLKRELASGATVGSDQFVYYDPTSAKKKLSPDAFVKLGVPHSIFSSWKTWQRGAPDVAVEVASASDFVDEAWDIKLERYRAAGIGEVVRFDADNRERPIRVWDHVDGDLVERERPEDGVFECAPLGLYWVALPHPAFDQVLRLARDREGRDLLPTPEEAEARARQEEARARQEEARARQEEARARQEEARARQEEEHARRDAEAARDTLAAEVAELRRRLAESGAGAGAAARPPKKAPGPQAPAAGKQKRPPSKPKRGSR